MSGPRDGGLDGLGARLDPETAEVPRDVPDVPGEPLRGPRVVKGDGLPHVDHDDLAIPDEEVVLAEVRVDELRLPNRTQVPEYVLVYGHGVLELHVLEEGGGPLLVSHVLHDEDVLLEGFGPRDPHAGVGHPEEVLVLLPGPCQDRRFRASPHVLEPGVTLDVPREVPERRRVNPIDLDGLPAPLRIRPMEHVRLLPRADGVVEGREVSRIDELLELQEGRMVEHLVVRLPGCGVFLPFFNDTATAEIYTLSLLDAVCLF